MRWRWLLEGLVRLLFSQTMAPSFGIRVVGLIALTKGVICGLKAGVHCSKWEC
jgi:hypothetical protein